MIIHMETEKVNLAAWRLAKTAESLDVAASGLTMLLQSLDWEGLGRDEFIAESRRTLNHIRRQAEAGILLSQSMRREVDEWLAADRLGEGHFQEANRSWAAADSEIAGGGGVLLARAQVLGISTSTAGNQYIQEYQNMPWGNKFEEDGRLQTEINDSQVLINGMRSEEEIQKDINSIDAQIADLEQKRADAQAEAEKWYNQIIPDWPPQGDSDGLPWRVRADDFDDQVADYNRQIQALQAQKQALQTELTSRLQEQARLVELQSRQSALTEVINQGVPADGPTKPDWLRKDLGGCTLYVAEKRNVYAWPNSGGSPGHPGNAQYWNDQALQAGYEVGTRPVKGSIMVFEPDHGKYNGIMQVSDSQGHVAYVEGVERVDGGYKVTISQASTQYDDKGGFVRGVYIKQNTTTVLVNDGQQVASFIYDKPAK